MVQSKDEQTFALGAGRLDPSLVADLCDRPIQELPLAAGAAERVATYRKIVDDTVRSGRRVYGINTGFGFLADVAIPDHQLAELQSNLVRSHACGVGEAVDVGVSRAQLLIKAENLCHGASGVRLECVEQIRTFLLRDIIPVIPSQGSVGASGDLAPLAHMALALMGEGKVHYRGEIAPTGALLRELGIKPLVLAAKEGLSLINGTQFMTAVACFAVRDAARLCAVADAIAALSLDGIRGTLRAFDPEIHELRPHAGQAASALAMRTLFAGGADRIMESHADCGKVQDPYSFRCIPQVHGASRDVLAFCRNTVHIELGSVTDNPLVNLDGSVRSGGNFHGQPIAMAMDFLAIAVSELGSISERRTEKLTNPNLSGLPAFITKDSGLNSGFMIPHVAAAALASENKILCHPAVVDSIPTSADKEDHVSMGPIAALKARRVIANVSNILAIELLAACQAIDILKPLEPAPALQAVYRFVRSKSPAMDKDRSLSDDIAWLAGALRRGEVEEVLATAGFSHAGTQP